MLTIEESKVLAKTVAVAIDTRSADDLKRIKADAKPVPSVIIFDSEIKLELMKLNGKNYAENPDWMKFDMVSVNNLIKNWPKGGSK